MISVEAALLPSTLRHYKLRRQLQVGMCPVELEERARQDAQRQQWGEDYK